MSTPKGNRNRRGYSPLLNEKAAFGDPRDRQNANAGVDQSAFSAPLVHDANGRLTIATDPRSPLVTRTSGELGINVDHGLGVRTGSPPRMIVLTSDTVVVGEDGLLHARLTPYQIQGMTQFVQSLAQGSGGSGVDISYAEPLVADSYTETEAPLVYNEAGTDILVSELLY